jgi:hypothetical protein
MSEENYYIMYTCENGIDLMNTRRMFYVWDINDAKSHHLKIKFPKSSVRKFDDEGLPDCVCGEGVEIIEEDNSN